MRGFWKAQLVILTLLGLRPYPLESGKLLHFWSHPMDGFVAVVGLPMTAFQVTSGLSDPISTGRAGKLQGYVYLKLHRA